MRRATLTAPIIALLLTASASGAMSVDVSPEALTVTSLVPGTSVALFSVAREPSYHMSRVVSRHEVLVDEDRDGAIRFEPRGGVAHRSIWIVVDLRTGQAVVAAPHGVTPLAMRQRGAARGKSLQVVAGTVDVGRDAVDLLVVRPTAGAWTASGRDASSVDADRIKNGRVRVDLTKLRPLGSAGDPPHALRKGDVVAVLDAAAMEYAVMTATEGDQ